MNQRLRVVSHNLAITSWMSYDGTMTSMLPGIRLRVPLGRSAMTPSAMLAAEVGCVVAQLPKLKKNTVNQRMK